VHVGEKVHFSFAFPSDSFCASFYLVHNVDFSVSATLAQN
jgi:hypothetical protein